MNYSRENAEKAAEILSQRRQKAQTLRSVRHAEIAAKIPDIVKYESQMADSGLAVIKALGMGENAEKYISELSEINLKIQDCIKKELINAGYPADYLDTPYTCRKCGDTGFVDGVSCSCRRELLKNLSIEALRSVSRAEECRFDNFDISLYPDEPDVIYGISQRERMNDVFEYCKAYAEDFDTESCSLYLHGATGLGKTHLSLAIANVVAEKGYSVVYGPAQNIMSELEREKFSYDRNRTNEAEERIMDCDLLIIDDLGSEFVTNFTVTCLYNIINTRINTSKPVIINTNLSEKEFEEKYTQRITSRLVGSYTNLIFVGRDIRQIKSEN